MGFGTQELTCSSKAKAYIHHTGKGNFPEGQKKVAPHYLSTTGVKLSITYKMAVLVFTGVKSHLEVDPLICEGSRLTFKMSVQKNAPPQPCRHLLCLHMTRQLPGEVKGLTQGHLKDTQSSRSGASPHTQASGSISPLCLPPPNVSVSHACVRGEPP